MPEVTVDVDGVVVVLVPSRRRGCVRRPLPSVAGSSPKDTQPSEQICASKQSFFELNNMSSDSLLLHHLQNRFLVDLDIQQLLEPNHSHNRHCPDPLSLSRFQITKQL